MLTEQGSLTVSQAVTRAEAATDGEIATIVAARSDAYADVAANLATMAMLLVPALATIDPRSVARLAEIGGGWGEPAGLRAIFTTIMILMALTFLLVRGALAWTPLRLALVPAATKTRRVRAEAMRCFRVGTEARTAARNGVLLYLSAAERRAEIVVDAGVHSRVPPETWGEAMAVLLQGVRAGKPADGMVAAVERIGVVLAEHFPRTGTDLNEMPDRLISL